MTIKGTICGQGGLSMIDSPSMAAIVDQGGHVWQPYLIQVPILGVTSVA